MRYNAVLLCVVMLGACFCLEAQMEDWLWARRAGGIQIDYAEDIATDSAGNCYLTGRFSVLGSFGATDLLSSGDTDIFIAKLDPLGNWLWAVRAGGIGTDTGTAIDVDADGNVYVTGYFSATATFGFMNQTSFGGTDYFIAKLDTNGGWIWAQKSGTIANDYSWDITLDGLCNAYITGQFGDDEVMVAKYDSYGASQFFWAAAEASEGNAFAIVSDLSGNVTITGYFLGQIAFGSHVLNSYGAADIFVARMSNTGIWSWAVHAGGPYDDYGTSVDLNAFGDAYFTGFFILSANFFGQATLISSGLHDIFVARLDTAGNMAWVAKAGGTGMDAGACIRVDDSGQAFVTGAIGQTAVFGSTTIGFGGDLDIFAAAISSAGIWEEVVWAGGTGQDNAGGIIPDNFGNLYLTGYFSNGTVFGEHALTSEGGYDIFIAKMGPQQPMTPQNLSLYRDGAYAVLTWDPVTQSIYGQPLSPDYYFVYASADNSPASYSYLGMTLDTLYYHEYVMLAQPSMFYSVTAVKAYNRSASQEEKQAKDSYLQQRLKPGMQEKEVEAILHTLR